MVLQEDGPISLEDVQNEFGGDDPINFNEYYPNAYTGYPGHEDDLLLWLKFDTSIVQDSSSYNHSISKFTGTTPTLDGVDNKKGDSHLKISANTGYVINQSTKYVIPEGTAELSVCFWMRNSDTDGKLFRYRGSLLAFGNYNNAVCSFDMTNITSIYTTPLVHSEWKHYVFTVIVANGDSSTKVYIDGIDNTNSWTKSTNTGRATGFTNSVAESSGTKFGLFFNHYYYAGDYGQYFQGDVDDFRIYNKALSPTEVQHVIGYTTPLSSENLQLLIEKNTDPIDLSTFYRLGKLTFEYPPYPMIDNYDSGMYTSASSILNNWSDRQPYIAFNKQTSSQWTSQLNVYDATTGAYNIYSRGLTDIYGTKHFGEWIQIRFLNKICMNYCLIYPAAGYSSRSAKDGVILGTNTGTTSGTDGTWVVISSFNDKSYADNVGTKIDIDTGGVEYKYYAIVGKVVLSYLAISQIKFFSTTTPTINTNGLEFLIDPMSASSYVNTAYRIYNLLNGEEMATLAGTYVLDKYISGYVTYVPLHVKGIRLFNESTSSTSNPAKVDVIKTINITTVSIWLYIHSIPTTAYILDSRTGMPGGYIYSGGTGSDWASGKLYVNGGSQQSILWSNVNTTGVWRNITFVANNPGFDSMNLFSRYTNGAGLNVTFGPIMIYNREISEEENRQNYNYYCEAFGLIKAYFTINTNGLEFYIDTMRSSSYSGSGNTIYNLLNSAETATLGGTYSLDTSLSGVRGIRLSNTSGTRTSNVSRVNVNKNINITTVSIWLYIHSTPTTVYILDSRTGMTGGWIYNGGPGSSWATGKLYVNGGNQQSILWSNMNTTGVWRNITFVANNPGFDSMTLFSRYSNNEGLNVTFGPIMIYNRELSEEENRQNYNYYCETFGLSKASFEYPPMALTSNNSNGYICTRSTFYSTGWDAWKAFNKVIGGEGYHSAANTYNTSTGSYISNKNLTDTTSSSHYGEWLQLKLPVAKQMVYCTIAPRTNYTNRAPRSGLIMGSNAGVNGSWVVLTNFSNKSYSNNVETEIMIDSNQPYLYYVLVCKTLIPHSSSSNTLNISELKYFAHH